MRIIGGKLKGSILHMPKDKNTRPLKDLARESIFNLLAHSNKISLPIQKSNILDLYAGTGSFGLECISRYAEHVCFVENEDLNKWMVSNGYAIAYRRYSKDYILDEEFAKINKLGLWSGTFLRPEKWRKLN